MSKAKQNKTMNETLNETMVTKTTNETTNETTVEKKVSKEVRDTFYNSNRVLEFDSKTKSTKARLELTDKELILKTILLQEDFEECMLDNILDTIIEEHRDLTFTKKVNKSKDKNKKGLIQRKTKLSFTSSELIPMWQIKRTLASLYIYQNILVCLENRGGIFYLVKKDFVGGLTTYEQKKKK